MYASRYIRNRQTTVGEPVSSCQAHSRGSRSLPSPISPSLAAPPAELRFTVKVAADPFASAMEEQVPVATLHYDTSARRVRLTNPSIYQPLFLNGARVFSLEGVTLTEGCVVEVHPSLLREGQGLTADPSLPPSPEATGQSGLATLSPPPPPPLGPHRSAQPCGARSSLSPQAGKRTPERPTQHTATDAFVQFGDGPRDRKVSFAHVVGRAVANGAAHHPASVEDADSANLLDMGRKDRSFALPEMPRRSSTQQPPSSPENSVVVVAAAARTCGAEACVTWCPAGASVFWTQTEEATAPLAADGTPMPSLVNACPPLAGMTLHEASVSGGGSFPLSIRHPTLTTEQQPSTDTDAAASAGSEDSDSSSSCGAVHGDLTLSPVALYVSSRHGVVEGTIARAGPGGTRAARALSAQATAPAAAASFSTDRRRLSSLVSDTILSQRTRRLFANPTTLCGMGERRVPPTVATTAAATACGAGKRTLEILSLHFDARGRCLRPFSPAEKLVLYEQFAVAIRSWRHRLRHTKTVLRLSSPLFCCGEVNGNFAALWGAVLQPLCPFGRLSLLGTPLLLLGNYLGDAGEEEGAVDADGGVHVMLALAALSAASPDSIHLLRGRGEVFSEDSRAQLRSRSIAYFGAANGREFARAVVDLLSSLPLAAVVDESIFASHSGIPPVPLHVLPGYEWVAHERCFFDQVLAGVVPHSCFQTVDVAASDNALHGKTAATKSQEVYRRLLEALVGIRASPDEASSHPAKSASSCPFPPLSRATSSRGGVGIAEALRGFLQRYEFSMVLHGVGGGDAGVCVTNQARLVNLSTAPGDVPSSLSSPRSGGGSACIVTPGTVQLVCWRSASLPSSPSARASPTPDDDRHACSPSRHPVGSTVRRQHRPAQALSTSMSTVHYVMGVPMPLGRAYFYNPDPDGVLTVSRELTSSFSPRGQRSRSSSILTLSEDREVEYG